jgi:uncharacterized protein YodC (DUF2158 family)
MGSPLPVGTIVWLKSGGPPLTVTDIGRMQIAGEALVDVEWFAGDVLQRDAFHRDSLTTEQPNGRS